VPKEFRAAEPDSMRLGTRVGDLLARFRRENVDP
jgi:hypothetical protein